MSRASLVLAAAYLLLLGVGVSGLPSGAEWADVVLVPLLASTLVDTRGRIVGTPLAPYILAFVATTLACTAMSAQPRLGMVALLKDIDVAIVFFIFVALVARTPATFVPRWLAAGATASALAGLLGFVVATVSRVEIVRLGVRMTVPVAGNLFRPSGLLYSPEMLSELITCAIPFIVWMALEGEAVWWVAAAACLAVAALTASHGVGGCLVAVIVLWWPQPSMRWRRARWPLAAAVVAIVAALNVVSLFAIRQVTLSSDRVPLAPPAGYHYTFDEPGGPRTIEVALAYSPMSYLMLKRVAVAAFRGHPWFGIGPGAFHLETARAAAEGSIPTWYREADPHSTLFGRLAETGLVGTSALIAVWTALVVCAWRAVRVSPGSTLERAAFAAVTGILVNSVNADVMHFRFLWVAAAVALSRVDLLRRSTPAP